jgi:hypothetical protein
MGFYMSKNIEESLNRATGLEKGYEWLKASKLYEQALSMVDERDYIRRGEILERAAYCRGRAAYKSENREEFKTLLEATSSGYNRAAEIYGKLESPIGEAMMLTTQTMEHFYKSWLVEDPPKRKTEVACCIEEFKEALRLYEDAEESPRFGKACNDFLAVLYSYSELSFTRIEGAEIIETALEYGGRALGALRQGNSGYELARCYYLLSMFLPDRPMDVIESVERQQELFQLGTSYAETAVELSRKTGDPYLIGMSCGILSLYIFEGKGDPEVAMPLARRQLEIGEKIGDRLVLARAHEHLSYYLQWVAALEEDRDNIRVAANEAIRHADESISHYRTILNPILTPFLPRNECNYYLSKIETDPELKRKYNIVGLEASQADLKYATESGSLLGQMYVYSLLGSTYLWLAKFERDEHEKHKLLNDSMRFKEKYIDSATAAQPFRFWNLSGAYKGLADTKEQITKCMDERERKVELLSEAIEDMERSIDFFNTHNRVNKITRDHKGRAAILLKYGEILFQMHLASESEQHLEDAIQQFTDAIEIFKKINMPTRISEILWKKAWAYYRIHEYQKAATEFDGASRYYLQAGKKYPNHRQFYADYGSYMEAWGNIARAMDYHSRDEYFLEKEYFEKAVHLQMTSARWRYLSPNYLAWARLAEAENQSRNEQCEKAIELFRESSDLFSNAKKTIEDKIASIGVVEEANMAMELITASDIRMDYCHGRVALEEAKLLDRQGEHAASSNRYGDAAKTFHKIIGAMKTETERREIRPLHTLCRAWQKMTQAEAEASSNLYFEASALFKEAEEHSASEKTRLLTRGHASFCRALGVGIKYESSREEDLHKELVRHIGGATDLYVRAGFESAMEYSMATQRLFEAYQYMDLARGTLDPVEQTRYFTFAERLLGLSADAFRRARHPEKSEEVERLVESLRRDREVAVSLSELLDAPGISSSTESFRIPTPSHEYPVGLEGFERAEIQARVLLSSKVVSVGEEFDLELEFYNPGRASVSLMRVEGLISGDFEVGQVSGVYRFDGGALDLRGKRIGPLGTVGVSLRATPLSKGDYRLEPRLVFIDDDGEQRSSAPEPIAVTVREMGIMGWLRGTRQPD